MKKLLILILIASLSVLAVAGILTQYGEIQTTANVIDPILVETIFDEPLEDWNSNEWNYPCNPETCFTTALPCVGNNFSLVYKNNAYITTPTVTFYNKTNISFQYKVEDEHTVKENLSVYLDYGTPNQELLWQETEITYTTCQPVTINLDDSYTGDHTITWLCTKADDSYALILDDITVKIIEI